MARGIVGGLVKITQAEILDALQVARRADIGPAHAMTVGDMAVKAGVHRHVIEAELARIKREGRLHIYRVERERLDGVKRLVPAYVIAPKRKRK